MTMKKLLSKALFVISILSFCAYALPSFAENPWQNSTYQTQGGNSNNSWPSGFGDWTKSQCSTKDCSNTTCTVQTNNQGRVSSQCPSGKRYDVDANCVMNQNASGCACLDTIPAASITRVAETICYRASGAGGNATARNHFGNDYGAAEGTFVTAAADGVVVWAKPMGMAGRTIVIEHEKKCSCSGNGTCDKYYTSVYMHLSAYVVTGGSVKKGDVIGLVGGSNYVNKILCDPPKKALYDGDCYAYSPHLHFELHSGSFREKGYTKYGHGSIKDSIIDPLCDDIQSFCGGGSNNTQEECTGKTNTNQWQPLSEEAKQNKSVATPPENFSTTSPSSGEDYNSSGYAQGGGQDAQKCAFENFMPDNDTCYFCPLFKVIFNTASTLAQKSYNALKDGVANLVLIGFALWIALFVFRHVSSLEVKKPSKMIQELLIQSFRVLVVFLILKLSYFQVLNLTLGPVFNTGMAYAQQISGTKECNTGAPYMQGISGYTTTPGDGGALPASMGQNVVCSIKSMQDNVYKLIAYGNQCRCFGWHIKPWVRHLIPNFAFILTGWLLKLGGLILLLAFPWCLVDCLLNMAIAAALLPAAIGAWAFKITAQYLKKIWDIFLNAVFQFVFLSVILSIIMVIVGQFVGRLELYATDFDTIINPITGLAFWGVNAARLLLVCLLGWVFLDQGKSLAKNFASAPSVSVGGKTGGFFAQAATRISGIKKGKDGKHHGVWGLATGTASLGGMAANHYLGMPIRRKINQNRINKLKNTGTAVKDASGKVIAYETTKRGFFGLGRKITQRVNIDKDGLETLSKQKMPIMESLSLKSTSSQAQSAASLTGGRFQQVHQDNLLSIREKTAQDGTLIQRDYAWNSKVINQYMSAQDGTLNHYQLSEIFKQSSMSLKTINESAALTILNARGQAVDNKFNSRNIAMQGNKFVLTQENRDGSTTTLETQFGTTLNINGQEIETSLSFNRDGLLETNLKLGGQETHIQIDQDGQVFTTDSKGAHKIIGKMTGALQMVSTLSTTDVKGNKTIITDNGLQRRIITQPAGRESAVHYEFNDSYHQKYSHTSLMDGNGNLSQVIDNKAAMLGFDENDRALHAAEIRTGSWQAVNADALNTKGLSDDGRKTAQAQGTPLDSHSIDPKLQKQYDAERAQQFRFEQDKRQKGKDKSEQDRRNQLANAYEERIRAQRRRDDAIQELKSAERAYKTYLSSVGPDTAYQDSKLADLKAKFDNAQSLYAQAQNEYNIAWQREQLSKNKL